MNAIIKELDELIESYFHQLNQIPENKFSSKQYATRWSKKEIIGHLADSAMNNIRRFIVSQYEIQPVIQYNQDEWVRLNGYQHTEAKEVIQLWYLLNKEVIRILKNTPEANFQKTCFTGEVRSINWLAADYIKHMKHHMHVVLELEPVNYP